MAETYENEQIEEKVILVGISEQDGDDAEDSLAELAELVKTAGAVVVGTLIVRPFIRERMLERVRSMRSRSFSLQPERPELCVMMNYPLHR